MTELESSAEEFTGDDVPEIQILILVNHIPILLDLVIDDEDEAFDRLDVVRSSAFEAGAEVSECAVTAFLEVDDPVGAAEEDGKGLVSDLSRDARERWPGAEDVDVLVMLDFGQGVFVD